MISQLAWRSTQEVEGTPLERVQVVNSGARVQIPPSPLDGISRPQQLFEAAIGTMFRASIQNVAPSTLTNKQQCNPENSLKTFLNKRKRAEP